MDCTEGDYVVKLEDGREKDTSSVRLRPFSLHLEAPLRDSEHGLVPAAYTNAVKSLWVRNHQGTLSGRDHLQALTYFWSNLDEVRKLFERDEFHFDLPGLLRDNTVFTESLKFITADIMTWMLQHPRFQPECINSNTIKGVTFANSFYSQKDFRDSIFYNFVRKF